MTAHDRARRGPARMLVFAAALLLGAPMLHAQPGDPHAGHAQPKQLYTCGMHPQVIRDRPGTCPICGMELTPLVTNGGPSGNGEAREADDAGPAVTIDPAVVQNMGVRTAAVRRGTLRRSVRAVAVVREPEPSQHDIALRVSGWIERLFADVEGMPVRAGEPLFELYSPELQVAIGELIGARAALPREAAPGSAAALLYETGRQKLELLGLPRAQVDRLARLDRPPATVTFTSPITGHVTEKLVVAGDAVQAGERVLRLSDRGTMWIDARIFEQDLALVGVGRPATVHLASLPGEPLAGRVTFVHPHLDPTTRTALARIEVANPGERLLQGMYATVVIDAAPIAGVLLAPREAVIDTGTEQVVFIARAEGHFAPRRVTVGPTGDDGLVEIRAGLAAGDTVVTSGQFLLDAESNFREAVARFLGTAGEPMPAPPAGDPDAAPPAPREAVPHVH